MVSIASRATSTCGVKIPNRKHTRKEILNSFKHQMKALREQLNVSYFIQVQRSALISIICYVRVHLPQVKLVLHAMPGRHRIPMRILQ